MVEMVARNSDSVAPKQLRVVSDVADTAEVSSSMPPVVSWETPSTYKPDGADAVLFYGFEAESAPLVSCPDRMYLVLITRRGMTCEAFDSNDELAAAFDRAAADPSVIDSCAFVGRRVILERRNVVQVSITTDSGLHVSRSELNV